MAQQGVEALNRTFHDLKSKSEDTRVKASYELRELVVTAVRGICSAPFQWDKELTQRIRAPSRQVSGILQPREPPNCTTRGLEQ